MGPISCRIALDTLQNPPGLLRCPCPNRAPQKTLIIAGRMTDHLICFVMRLQAQGSQGGQLRASLQMWTLRGVWKRSPYRARAWSTSQQRSRLVLHNDKFETACRLTLKHALWAFPPSSHSLQTLASATVGCTDSLQPSGFIGPASALAKI